MLRRGFQRRQQRAQEDLVVHGGACHAAIHHDALHGVGEQRGPVIGLQAPHRKTIDRGQPLDAELLRHQAVLRPHVVGDRY